MPELQATYLPDGGVFFWSPLEDLDGAVERELPLVRRRGRRVRHPLAAPAPPHRRERVPGYELELVEAVRLLARLGHDAAVSDSVRVWSRAAQLGLELAVRQRVVPTVVDGVARWRVLLTRAGDRERYERLARSLPVVGRSLPTRARGPVRLASPHATVRDFLDRTVDSVYRQAAWPGTSRGWALELAEALRGGDATFSPRDARFQGVPQLLADWSGETEAVGLRVGMRLGLPEDEGGRFPVSFFVYSADDPARRAPLREAWGAGTSLVIDGVEHLSPAYAALRGLARASRVFPPLAAALGGPEPRDLSWDATEAWAFLAEGVEGLRDAGFEIELPEVFDAAGRQRIRARMCVAAAGQGGALRLDQALSFRWEVVLGDRVIDGADFAGLVARREPIVRYRGEWVLLDPAELRRLPDGLPQDGLLDGAAALRAVLTGEHEGVPVVADERLRLVLAALADPPPVEAPAGLRGTLRPYQARGLAWLHALAALGLGACLADDMGLGKTIQLIAHLLSRRSVAAFPSLVVCPTSVLGNWVAELERFAPGLRVARYHGLDRDDASLRGADVVVTTYGLLVRDADALAELDWDVVALDEAQAIKNPDSQRARAARRLRAAHRVALSGTPVENRLLELWSLMEFLIPGLLGPRGRFRHAVAIPIERFGDAVAAERLKSGIQPFVLRRVKSDPAVIEDLPEKIERRAWCSLTREQAALYEDVVESHLERIRGAEEATRRGHVLAMLTALKQVCNHPEQLLRSEEQAVAVALDGRSGKLDLATDLLEQILAEGHERALVFTQYRQMGELLLRHFEEVFGERFPFLHGGTPIAARDEMVRAFQEDAGAPPVLVISLRAGGTGLNLTRATHVLHFDRWWNPAVEDQATDRAYRIGQKRNVMVHKLITHGTLEERIDAMLEEKRALAESVVHSGDRWVTELDDDALRRLVSLGADAREED